MNGEQKADLKGCYSDNPETKEGKYLVLRRDDTVPEWPWFVLGARDPMASWALWFYSWVGIFYERNWAYLRGCNRKSWEFYRYRQTAGKGDPGKGRHRKDNPAVILRMREGRGT
jgi:hypothetical protein